MLRGTGRSGRRHRSLLPVALGMLVLGVAACDGGDFGDGADAGTDPVAKIDPATLQAVRGFLIAGRPQNLLAVLTQDSGSATPAGLDTAGRLKAIEQGLDRDKDRLLARLGGQRMNVVQQYPHLPVLHLRVESEAALQALADAPEVAHLEPEREFYPSATSTSANLSLIRQPAAANAGKIGTGTTVVVLDTGTDYKRAPFNCSAPGSGCKVAYAMDVAPDDKTPDDSRAHGTNVSGTILAVAPGARIIAMDVFDGTTALTGTILTAINWSVENQAKYNIVAINMSFGGGAYSSACTADALATAIATARTRGILSVVAAGNDAKTSAIASPACANKAISVGAVYDTALGKLSTSVCSDATSAADQIACFSNSAPFLSILAPGVAITAAGLTMSGTSQAAPHVAGAVAVLRSAFPNESLDATVDRLVGTGTGIRDSRNGLTKPRLNLEAAVAGTTTVVPVPPPPPPAPPAPKPGPTGTLTLNNGSRYTRSTTIVVASPTTSGTATQICVATTTTCSAWRSYAPSMIISLPSGDGSKTVRAWWKDAAGNVSAKPATATIGLDTTAPTGGKLTLRMTGNTASYSWVGVKDVGSGIASYLLVTRTDGPVPEYCGRGITLWNGASKVVTQVMTPGKLYRARLCAIDAMGNVSAGIAGQFELPLP